MGESVYDKILEILCIFCLTFLRVLTLYPDPRMMLLIGICINRMKNPINPINKKPIDVAIANFLNSLRSGFVHLLIKW